MIALIRKLALPIAITSLIVNAVMLLTSCILWAFAIRNNWVNSVIFVAHISMLALVFAATTGVAAALAGILALVPTDDLVSLEPKDEE